MLHAHSRAVLAPLLLVLAALALPIPAASADDVLAPPPAAEIEDGGIGPAESGADTAAAADAGAQVAPVVIEPSAESCAAYCPPPPAAPAKTPWIGDVAIGFVNTTGNTRTRSFNGRAALEYRGNRIGNRFSVLGFTGSRDGLTTDERYSAANKVDLKFSERQYAFVNLAYDNDRFAGVAERYAATLGYGLRVLGGPAHRLDVELGAGANRLEDQTGVRENSAIGTLGGKYLWVISPTAEFSQTLRTEAGRNNIYVNPITQLKLTIIGNLFATLNHEVRYNTQVPDGTVRLDQITTINFGYTFGTP